MRILSTVRTLMTAAALFAAGVGQSLAFELQWFGQAAFKLTTETGKVIVIDPFLLR